MLVFLRFSIIMIFVEHMMIYDIVENLNVLIFVHMPYCESMIVKKPYFIILKE